MGNAGTQAGDRYPEVAVPEDPARQLGDRYDRDARSYRELWAPVLRPAGQVLLRHLVGAPVERVVDIGTGVGALLPDVRAAFPGALIVGVDRSAGMLALAPEETPRAVMDARQLALPDGSVDLVLMVFMLFHLEAPALGLAEARRILRGGGRLGTLTWGGDLESRATRLWTECLDAYGADPPDPANETRDDPVNTPRKMEALLRNAGFRAQRSWADDLVCTLDAEHVLRLKTSLGSSKPRFDSLASGAREACVAEGRRRMKELSPEDFAARGSLVYSIGGV